MNVSAVIAAAGKGLRMNSSTRKQFLILDGIPVLARSLQLFLDHDRVKEIVVVCPPGEKEETSKLLEPHCRPEMVRLVEGGATRQESVRRGIMALCQPAGLVCIHDAARPFASTQLIDKLLEAAALAGAAVPVVVPGDTVKEIDGGGMVLRTLQRASLRLVQTPQVFKGEVIAEAYRTAGEKAITATDDASLVEALGRPVVTVPGEESNIKITTPLDLALATLLLKG